MVYKTSKNATVFQEGIVVTLAILVKLRLPTEAKRLLYRVIWRHKNSYSLSTKFGPLKGLATAGQMNLVISLDPALLEDIRVDWPDDIDKIGLPKAVQKTNDRGTIASLQKAGRVAEKAKRAAENIEDSAPGLAPIDSSMQATDVAPVEGPVEAAPEGPVELAIRPKRKRAVTATSEPGILRISGRKGKGVHRNS